MNTAKNLTLSSLLFGAALAVMPPAVLADSGHTHSHEAGMAHDMAMPTPSAPAAAPAAATTSPMADMYTAGEIRKIDTAQNKLTIKHGDIKNLGMPGMTMMFKVKSPQLLSNLQVGDKVQFVVERADGGLMITDLKKATGQ